MTTRPYVFVTRNLPGDALKRLAQEVDMNVWPKADPPPVASLRASAHGADGLLTMITDRIDAELLDEAKSVKIVSQMAVGYDNIDVAACTQRGVLVTNTPGVLTETVADLTLGLMLAWSRRLIEGEKVVREGRWPSWRPNFLLGRNVHGATLGLVGLGAIGLAVARRAHGFGMRIIYSSRTRRPEAEEELGLEYMTLPQLLGEADFVSLHVALTPDTKGLIGGREIGMMKDSAVLINTARGAVVDQLALVAALAEERIAGAALDVFEDEPISPDDPLLSLDNVLVQPHVGSGTLETRSKMADLAVDNLLAFFRGERPLCCVN